MAEYIAFQPRDYFKTHLYTGTGASNAQTFPETTAMQPDFTWIKNRDAADFHVLTDSVRGVTKYISINDTVVEATNVESLKSFDSDGFTVGTMNEVNTNTEDFVSWNWKAGTTTGITTDGSTTITPSSYSFNQTSGFSILNYAGNGTSGAKLAHGLGAIPTCIIIKAYDYAGMEWQMYHHSIGNTKYLYPNSTNGSGTGTGWWNDTTPDSVNITLGNANQTNSSSYNYVAYCFAPIKGYSKFGGYYGNGNADGTFVYTGFRPAFVVLKRTAGADAWQIVDDKRLGYNAKNSSLMADRTTAEDTSVSYIDILSNGFKLRTTGSHVNNSGELNIYMAFAEFPFVSSNDIPGVAR